MKETLLTFDLEYWFESLSIQKYLNGHETDRANLFVEQTLNLLQKNKATATFFVTGKVLEKEPEVVKKIYQAGHEVAVHSLDHRPLWDKNPEKFSIELKEMINQIKKITNKKPIGHRAVNFSLNQQTEWALDMLAENGFKYDSSIFPFRFKTALFLSPLFGKELYGVRSNELGPYKINSLTAFPIAVWKLWKIKYPVTGGICVRFTPFIIFKFLLKSILKKRPACIHFHSFDFAEQIPDIKMPGLKKFIKYFNTKNTWGKLEHILKSFECVSVEKYLKIHENTTHQSAN